MPEVFAGLPIEAKYMRLAPNREGWPTLIEKLVQLDSEDYDWSADVAAIKAPTLIMIGDSDGIQLEHAVEMFQLLGGGVPGDMVGLPNAQFAVLPGTMHTAIMYHVELLMLMIGGFLDTPMPDAA